MTLGKSDGRGTVVVGAKASVGVLREVDCSTIIVVGSQDSESVMVAVAGMLVMTGVVVAGGIVTEGVVSTRVSLGIAVLLAGTTVGVVKGRSEGVGAEVTGADVSVTGAVSFATEVEETETVVVGREVDVSGSVELLIVETEVGSSLDVGRSEVAVTRGSVDVELPGIGSMDPVTVDVGTDVVVPSVNVSGVLVVVCSTGTPVVVEFAMVSVVGMTVVGADTGISVEDVMLTTESLGTGRDVVGSVEISMAEVMFTRGSVGSKGVLVVETVGSVGEGRAVGVGIGTSDEETTEVSTDVELTIESVMFVGTGISLEIKDTIGSSGLVGLVSWLAWEVAPEVDCLGTVTVASVEEFSADGEVDSRADVVVWAGRAVDLPEVGTIGSVTLTLGATMEAAPLVEVC